MNRLIITILLAFMFSTAETWAQGKQHISIEWKIGAVLPAPDPQQHHLGVAGPIAGVHNEVLIIAGGANFPESMPWLGGAKQYYNDVYIFKRDANKKLQFLKKLKLPFPVAYSSSCSTPQGIFVAGGENDTGILDEAFLIQWDKDGENIAIKALPPLPFAVTNASVTPYKNSVYLAGGETSTNATDQFISLDLSNLSVGWKQLPAIPHPVSHAVLVAQAGGKHQAIYLIGGRKKNSSGISKLYKDVYAFDLTTNRWEEKHSIPYPLSAGTGLACGTNNILLFGGDKGETFNKAEKLIAAINDESDAAKKEALNQQKIRVQSTHPGFSNEVSLYNSITGKWTTVGSIPFATPVTTVAFKWGSDVLIAPGEIKAGVRTPQILMGKLKADR